MLNTVLFINFTTADPLIITHIYYLALEKDTDKSIPQYVDCEW